MNKYFPGDLVEASKGDTLIRDRLATDGPGALFLASMAQKPHVGNLGAMGWTVRLVESGRDHLPAEPGWYVDDNEEVWRRSHVGNWHKATKHAEPIAGWEADLLIQNPVRLESRATTAALVLNAVTHIPHIDGDSKINLRAGIEKLRAEFGVTK